jgi:hypothetical protein
MRRLALAALLVPACASTVPAPSPSAQPPVASAAEGSSPPAAIGAKPATQLVNERCEIDYDAASDHFRCVVGGRTYEWSRFGLYLGPEPASALPQHRVIVRDGTLWVRYDRLSHHSARRCGGAVNTLRRALWAIAAPGGLL